jgi:feruloyl esterase
MKSCRRRVLTVLGAIGVLLGGGCHRAPPPSLSADVQTVGRSTSPCDLASLTGLRLEGGRVLAVSPVSAGGFTPEGTTRPVPELPAFCRVQAVATPTPGSRIHFEVWIPEGAWNGKLVVTGNGGYSPALGYGDMAKALRQGYAAIGGDTGHQTADSNDLTFVVGHPQRMADWGTRSIHAITVPGKQIVAALGGQPASRAYFYGCSTGGHQAYAEVQRYPGDFDGVIAGAPGNDRVRLNVGFLWQFVTNRERGRNDQLILPAAKLPMVTRAAVTACDARDGVTDGVVDDPRDCRWDPAALECRGPDASHCLTAPQLDALRRMYAGARNPRTGEQLYPGWPMSSETGWPQYWGRAEPARADFWRHWVFGDPAWDWWTFDFDRDVQRADAAVGRTIDHTSPDIDAFRARGGKLIVYQGWQDPVVSALGTVAYYERVRERQRSQAPTDTFFRLFMVPGMGHCAGGEGANSFGNAGTTPPLVDADHDLLAALDRWVELGIAPDRIIASRVVDGAVTRTRPLCLYPKRATYTGAGSTDDAANFVCT